MSFDPEKITFFAKTDARSQQLPFGIKAKDRQRHMYVIGKTGMGKSTLLENMAAQDIQSGEGIAFIDPHGSTAETLLDYIPEHRVNDVVYFAPFDLAHPVSFNVMEDVGPDKRHLVVSGLMSTFKKIWVDAWSARMEYILTNALLALIEYPDTTLLSVNRLFSDKNYRTRVVDFIKDPAVKSFWTEEFANYTDRFAAEALPAIQNKIGQFTGNPLIRNIIGQPHSSFDIRKIMDEKKILIMNLSKGLVGETNANLLGSMLTTRIYLAAMSRADLPVATMKTMPNFYFYVDEFQSFANATFANILSEARKYHLNLIIAHQYIAQMEEEVRDAVFGNVGTTVAFRVGPFDAEVLETVFTPRFLAPDLVNLGFAQICLTLMIDGVGSQPFSAVTLPPVEKPRVSSKDVAIFASRKNYAKSREEVEAVVTALHTPVKEEPKPKAASPSAASTAKPRANEKSREVRNEPSPLPPTMVKSDPRMFQHRAEERKEERPLRAEKTPTRAEPSPVPSAVRQAEPATEWRKDADASTPKSTAFPTTTHSPKSAPLAVSSQVEDLRAVLARLSQAEKKNEESGEKSSGRGSEKNGERNSERNNDRKGERSIERKIETQKSSNTGTNSADKSGAAAGENKKAELANILKNITAPKKEATAQPRPALVPHDDGRQESSQDDPRAELARLAALTEDAFASLTTTVRKVPQTPLAHNPLEPETLRKMVRQPKNERSPFAP